MIRVAVIMGKMDSGGKKNLVMEYYRHIDRNRIQFDFICDSDSNSIPYGEIASLGGKVYTVHPYIHIIRNMTDMYRLFKENNYSIVHAYNSTMNVFPMLVAKICGVPVRISESISTAHEGDWRTIIKKLLKPMSKLFATDYMSNGEMGGRWQFGDKLFDSGKVEVFKTVVNTDFNAFSNSIREQTRKEYGWEGCTVIGHIGRFVPQKNSVRVIDIFSAVAKMEPSAKLCLIGDGELKKSVIERIHELKLEDKVNYLGRREDIQQFYNAMDAFILPSLYEGLPVVGIEAECCGLPTFFSTEIPKESNACELGHFISLSESDNIWADEILREVRHNMPLRRSYASEVAAAGFDSESEAQRLQEYYLQLCRE